MSAWRKIKSAPRDGRRILVFGETHSGLRAHVAEYQRHTDWGVVWIVMTVDSHSPDCNTMHYMQVRNPTHWMPLPDDPEAA